MTPHATKAERLFEVWWKEQHPTLWIRGSKEAAKDAWLTTFTQGAAQERERHTELYIALQRLILHSREFQCYGDPRSEDEAPERNLTVALQLANEAVEEYQQAIRQRGTTDA